LLQPAKLFAIERKLFMNQSLANRPRTSTHRRAFIGLLAGLFVAGSVAFSGAARAADGTPAPAAPTPTKIAVVDLRKAYVAMAATKSSNDSIKGMQGELETMAKFHKDQLEEAQKAMSQVKPGSVQHQTMQEDLDKKALQFEMDEKSLQLRMVHQRGRQMKQALDEITAAATDMATKMGYDMVLVNNSTELPDNIGDMGNQDQLVNLIFARNFLYVSPKNDITDAVVAKLDAQFKGGATPPPAPAK
jgi:Skp family chaperone for outer membrane proteins